MSRWEKDIESYINHINKDDSDSFYLREMGVKTNISQLAGNLKDKVILDIGSGDGWLAKTLETKESYECDLIEPKDVKDRMNFSIQNVTSLKYPDDKFDTVFASLLLMWVADLIRPLREIYRITRVGGELIICLPSPYFYRTGEVLDSGEFLLKTNLSSTFMINDLFIAGNIGPFQYYYHPLEDYINGLIKTGWNIIEFKDWHIDLEEYLLRVNTQDTKIKRSGNVPLYTFIKANKVK